MVAETFKRDSLKYFQIFLKPDSEGQRMRGKKTRCINQKREISNWINERLIKEVLKENMLTLKRPPVISVYSCITKGGCQGPPDQHKVLSSPFKMEIDI